MNENIIIIGLMSSIMLIPLLTVPKGKRYDTLPIMGLAFIFWFLALIWSGVIK